MSPQLAELPDVQKLMMEQVEHKKRKTPPAEVVETATKEARCATPPQTVRAVPTRCVSNEGGSTVVENIMENACSRIVCPSPSDTRSIFRSLSNHGARIMEEALRQSLRENPEWQEIVMSRFLEQEDLVTKTLQWYWCRRLPSVLP